MKIKILFLILIFSKSFTFAQNKYIAIQNVNWDINDDRLDILEGAAAIGFNAYELTVAWTTVYPKYGEPAKWDQIDRQLAKAVSLNLKIGIRIAISRNWNNVEGFWPIEVGSMRDNRGNYQREYWNTTSFSYTYRPAIDKSKEFIKEVLNRYQKYQSNILFVTVVNSPTQELGFHYTNDFAEGDKFIGAYPTLFDYNKKNEDLYRDWIAKKYKDIFWFNYWNNTNFKSFSENAPVVNRIDPQFTFYGVRGKDWYLYRHKTLKDIIDEIAMTVKEVDPNFKYINSFGAVTDIVSSVRGTYAFKDLCKNTDGIKINDDLAFDHRFTMDVVRSNIPDKLIMNEVFHNTGKFQSDYIGQLEQHFDDTYQHGSMLNTVVIEKMEDFRALAPMLIRVIQKNIQTAPIPINPVATTRYKLSKAIDFNYYEDYIYKEWKKTQDAHPNQFINIELDEDLLYDDANFKANITENGGIDTTSNGNINNGGNTGTGTGENTGNSGTGTGENTGNSGTGTGGNTGSGGTGTGGNTGSGGTGTGGNTGSGGTGTGENTGNGGTGTGTGGNTGSGGTGTGGNTGSGGTGSGENTGSGGNSNTIQVNVLPIIRHSFPIQDVVINKDFVFLLPPDIFYDPDGYITRVQFLEKPSWLNIINGQVLIGKTPAEIGVYKVKIRGIDNRGGFVDANYNINVVAPSISFKIIETGYFDIKDKIKFLGDLKEGTQFHVLSPENSYNILAYCNIDSVKINFDLRGAYSHSRNSDYFPNSLFEEGRGFYPPIGDYLLYAEAFYKDKLVAKNEINFSFYSLASKLENWQVFPNPCLDVLNIQFPPNFDASINEFLIISASGQLIKKDFLKNNSLIKSFQLQGVPAGKYFLKFNDGEKNVTIPFVKL